jgi:hypothetical protein
VPIGPFKEMIRRHAAGLARPWQLPVDHLAAGGAYRPRRSDPPDWHTGRFGGSPYDEFVLGADDVLRRR